MSELAKSEVPEALSQHFEFSGTAKEYFGI